MEANQGFSLQETDDIFKLHAVLVNALSKVRQAINKIIIKQKHNEKHFIKDTLFNIQSLANQLYCFQSIISEGLESGKINFSVYLGPDLLKNYINWLHIFIWAFNKFLQKLMSPFENDAHVLAGATIGHLIELNIRKNKEINGLFSSTLVGVVLNLAYIYI